MPACPACHANLQGTAELTALLKDGTPVCPFCGVELQAQQVLRDFGNDAEDHEQTANSPAPQAFLPPPKSRIQVVESDPDRLVIYIPPGGEGAKSLGCMALFWNGFMCIFTPPWFFAGNAAGGGPAMLFIVPFLLLFWAIGLGMIWYWVRLKYTRTYLLLEPHRMVLQTQRFSRKILQESSLSDASEAHLVQAYQVNDVPVHAVHLPAEERTFKFGTQLPEADKRWLVETVNQFLGKSKPQTEGELPRFCSSCGAKLELQTPPGGGLTVIRCPQCGDPQQALPHTRPRPQLIVPRIVPADLPVDSPITIERDDPQWLVYSLPLIPAGKLRGGVALVAGGIGCLWVSVAGASLVQELMKAPGQGPQAFRVVDVLFQSAFLLPGFASLLIAVWIVRARLRVHIDPAWLLVRYGWGPFAIGRRLAIAQIDDVRLRSRAELERESRTTGQSSSFPGTGEFTLATVQSGKSFLPLSTLHEPEVATQSAGLARTRLQFLNAPLLK